ncbi:MAG: hypothetical protein ABR501_12525 [Pyrinomonadaceae bacterium]
MFSVSLWYFPVEVLTNSGERRAVDEEHMRALVDVGLSHSLNHVTAVKTDGVKIDMW